MRTLTILFAVLASFATSLLASEQTTIEESWVRAIPPTSSNTAAYMKISNHRNESITLASAHTNAAKMTQFHLSAMVNGVMKMQEQKQGIEIPANSTLELKPGSYHIMIMGLKEQLRLGSALRIDLNFSDDSTITLNVPVMAADSAAHSHSMDNKMDME